MKKVGLGLLLGFLPSLGCATVPADIVLSVDIPAPVEAVFAVFSSDEGVQSFFAPDSKIEFKPDGAYELYFFPDRPSGERGSEGTRVLAIEPDKRLSITWNAPVKWPEIRTQRTVVTFRFEPDPELGTRVVLQHSSWGEGEAWEEVNAYFRLAWPVIMQRLRDRFLHGPRAW